MTLRGSAIPQIQGDLIPVAVYDDGEIRQAEDVSDAISYRRLKGAFDRGDLKNLTVYAITKAKLATTPYEGPDIISDGPGTGFGATKF